MPLVKSGALVSVVGRILFYFISFGVTDAFAGILEPFTSPCSFPHTFGVFAWLSSLSSRFGTCVLPAHRSGTGAGRRQITEMMAKAVEGH